MAKKTTKPETSEAQAVTLVQAARDAMTSRFFIVLTVLFFIEMLVMVIGALLHVRTGLTIKTHCEIISGKAINCTSSDAQWYYVFNFAILPIVIFVSNILVSLKLLAAKGRQLALCWLWLTLLVGLVVVVLGMAMIVHVV